MYTYSFVYWYKLRILLLTVYSANKSLRYYNFHAWLCLLGIYFGAFYLLFCFCSVECSNIYESDELCDYWAMREECTSNPGWMSENCRESCRQCPGILLRVFAGVSFSLVAI